MTEPIGREPDGVLLRVAYDGAAFAGFAPQPGQRTVHGELLRAVQALDPGVALLRGASRTDAGVHARGQLVALDPSREIPLRGWALALARRSPPDLVVTSAARVPRGFSPRFAARRKHYRYTLLASPVADPFLRDRAWRLDEVGGAGVLERMREEAPAALGEHDFAAFRSSADQRTRTVRRLDRLDVSRDGRLLLVDVEGDGFLHNMVRILVGALVDVGLGRVPPGALARALASLRREDLGRTAPAAGLCLERVWLEQEPAEAWPTSA